MGSLTLIVIRVYVPGVMEMAGSIVYGAAPPTLPTLSVAPPIVVDVEDITV